MTDNTNTNNPFTFTVNTVESRVSELNATSITVPGGRNNYDQLGRALVMRHYWALVEFLRRDEAVENTDETAEALHAIVQNPRTGTTFYVKSSVTERGNREWQVFDAEKVDGKWTVGDAHKIVARCHRNNRNNPGETLNKYAYLMLMLAGIHINQQARSESAAWQIAMSGKKSQQKMRRNYAK